MHGSWIRLVACGSLLVPLPVAAQLPRFVTPPASGMRVIPPRVLRPSMVLRYAVTTPPKEALLQLGTTHYHAIKQAVAVTGRLLTLLTCAPPAQRPVAQEVTHEGPQPHNDQP